MKGEIEMKYLIGIIIAFAASAGLPLIADLLGINKGVN